MPTALERCLSTLNRGVSNPMQPSERQPGAAMPGLRAIITF